MLAPTAVPGGSEEILFNLVERLPDWGVAPQVISLAHGPLVERLEAIGADVKVIEAGRLRDPRSFRRISAEMAAVLRHGRFDIAYSNMPKAHLYLAIPARRHRVPALWAQMNYPHPASIMDRAASALPAAGVIALSHAAVAAQHRLNRHRRLHVLHPGIELTRFRIQADHDLRSRHRIPQDVPLISLVGRLQPGKGQREFLRAVSLIADSHPSAYFAVVGGAVLGWEGDYPEEVRLLAKELGLDHRVVFTGHTNEVHRWMAASDVVVSASHSEGFGLVIVEAMASGCAVVAVASSGGPRDIIEHGRTGLLCVDPQPQRLAEAMKSLLDSPELRAALGSRARHRVETYFSRERMTERFVGILHETVALGNENTSRPGARSRA